MFLSSGNNACLRRCNYVRDVLYIEYPPWSTCGNVGPDQVDDLYNQNKSRSPHGQTCYNQLMGSQDYD